MPEVCHERVISLGYSYTMVELGIGVRGSSFPSDCTLLCGNVCFAGSAWLDIDIGETKIVTCDNTLNKYWKVTYTEYMSEYAVRVKVCLITPDEEEPAPVPPPVGEVDYDRIAGDMQDRIDEAVLGLDSSIGDVGGAVAGVASGVDSMGDGLTSQISTLSSDLKGLVGEVSDGLGGKVAGVLEAVTDGIAGLSDKIDGLQFPTIDSIKAAFLDVCADLAEALWDKILDRIEERYPKDEEESD